MKFIVEKNPHDNDVEVKLHPDTKEKIYWISYYGLCVGMTVYFVRHPGVFENVVNKFPAIKK